MHNLTVKKIDKQPVFSEGNAMEAIFIAARLQPQGSGRVKVELGFYSSLEVKFTDLFNGERGAHLYNGNKMVAHAIVDQFDA